MPSVTGINLPMKEFLEKGSSEIPNLNGIKFTSNNFMEMLECIRLEDGRFDILNGFDEMLLCGMAVGARGGVGSTYNYSLPTYRNLYDAFLAGARLSRRSGRQNAGAGGKGMEFRMVFVEKSATAAANPYSYPEKRCRLASRCCPEMTVDGLSVRCVGFRLAISFSRNAGSPSGFSSGRPR